MMTSVGGGRARYERQQGSALHAGPGARGLRPGGISNVHGGAGGGLDGDEFLFAKSTVPIAVCMATSPGKRDKKGAEFETS